MGKVIAKRTGYGYAVNGALGYRWWALVMSRSYEGI
jgi:hypothetical protein